MINKKTQEVFYTLCIDDIQTVTKERIRKGINY